MKMGISVSTFPTNFGPIVYRTSSLDELNLVFSKLKQFGYDGVDLFIDQIDIQKAKQIRAILDANDLEVSMLVCIYLAELGVDLANSNESHRMNSVATYIQQFELGSILGAKTMPIGFIRGRLALTDKKDEYEARLANSLERMKDKASEKGITLCIEPINRYEINTFMTVDEVCGFIQKYKLDGIKVLPDLFHMNIEENNILESLERNLEYIGHMHVADSNRKEPGGGHIDYTGILSLLKLKNYSGYLSIEAIPGDNPDQCAIDGIRTINK